MMNKPDPQQHQRLVESLLQCGPEVILKAADLCDGHSIFDPQAFLEAGLPAEVVDHVTRTYQSDPSSPKSTLFVHGQPVAEVSGVYGLDLLRFLAQALGVQHAPALGRGYEARRLQAALHAHFRDLAVPRGDEDTAPAMNTPE